MMDTLVELRKIGGFVDLEREGSLRTSTSARRAHPALLLEIIETMILAKTDPQSSVLSERLKDSRSFSAMIEESLKLLNIEQIDVEVDRVSRLMDVVKRFYIGLNFILARSGHLNIVRVNGEGRNRITPRTKHADINDRLKFYYECVHSLKLAVDSLLSMVSIDTVAMFANEDNDISLDHPAMIDIEDPVSHNGSALDKYLLRSVRAARIAQEVESYMHHILDAIKKLRGHLELAYAQCAVLMSSRAIIA